MKIIFRLCFIRSLFLLILLTAISSQHSFLLAQKPLENTAFQNGENLEYQLYFNWKFIWIKAGTANLRVTQKKYNGEDVYRCHLITTGSKRTDKFFMMRDTLVGYLTTDLVPRYYRKAAREGKRYYIDEVRYDYPSPNKTRLRQRYVDGDGVAHDTTNTSLSEVYDMVSMLMRARSFDPTQFREGQRLNFYMADGNSVDPQILIYRGKKNFEMEQTGEQYRCLVFSFVEKVKGKEKEVVTFYITDDANHMPVRLDLFLRFGTAKAFLRKAENLRNPQTSIIRRKG